MPGHTEKTETILVRCSESTKKTARVNAAKRGKSMSEYLRDLVIRDAEGSEEVTA